MPLPYGRCDKPGDEKHDKKHPQDRIKNSDLIAAFFHEGPLGLVTELAHSVQVVAIIDLTPGSGLWALEAVKRKIPYINVTLASATHSCIVTCSQRSCAAAS